MSDFHKLCNYCSPTVRKNNFLFATATDDISGIDCSSLAQLEYVQKARQRAFIVSLT